MPRIRIISPSLSHIKNTAPLLPAVDHGMVARELGAEPLGVVPTEANPVSLYALRAALLDRRRSSGGRPGLEGTVRRQKIPLTDAQWSQLESIAQLVRASGIKVSAGQVASQLLDLALQQATVKLAAEVKVAATGANRTKRRVQPEAGASASEVAEHVAGGDYLETGALAPPPFTFTDVRSLRTENV